MNELFKESPYSETWNTEKHINNVKARTIKKYVHKYLKKLLDKKIPPKKYFPILIVF